MRNTNPSIRFVHQENKNFVEGQTKNLAFESEVRKRLLARQGLTPFMLKHRSLAFCLLGITAMILMLVGFFGIELLLAGTSAGLAGATFFLSTSILGAYLVRRSVLSLMKNSQKDQIEELLAHGKLVTGKITYIRSGSWKQIDYTVFLPTGNIYANYYTSHSKLTGFDVGCEIVVLFLDRNIHTPL